MDEKIFYDIFGYISILFSFIAFLSYNKNNMRFYGLLSTLFLAANLYYYQGDNGAIVCIISSVVKILSILFKEDKIKIINFLSPIIAILWFINFNTEGLIGILPALSLVFIVVADIQENIINMKFIYYGSVFSWLIYAIIIGSVPAILYDLVGVLTLSYSILKIRYLNNKFR